MAQRTTCYRSDAGNDFPTEYEALCDDLRHFINGVAKNKVIADDLTVAMIKRLDVERVATPGEPDRITFDGIAHIIARIAATRPATVDPAQGDFIADRTNGSIITGRIGTGPYCTCVDGDPCINPTCPVHGGDRRPAEPQMIG